MQSRGATRNTRKKEKKRIKKTIGPQPPCILGTFYIALGDYMSVQCYACIGGTNVGEDIRKLDYGQHVVSGTPGRVFGMLLKFRYIFFSYSYFVLLMFEISQFLSLYQQFHMILLLFMKFRHDQAKKFTHKIHQNAYSRRG